MRFGLALELSNVDLLNINIDRFVRYTFRFVRYKYSQYFLVSMMSSRRLQDMSSRHLQDMSSRRFQDMSSRRLQDVFKKSSA